MRSSRRSTVRGSAGDAVRTPPWTSRSGIPGRSWPPRSQISTTQRSCALTPHKPPERCVKRNAPSSGAWPPSSAAATLTLPSEPSEGILRPPTRRSPMPERPNGRIGPYEPSYEHDACGVAMVAKLDGVPTHETVMRAIIALENLEHRGAAGADPNTGDGAGILLQL